MAYGGKGLKGAMKAADRSGAPVVLVAGDSDLDQGVVQVKDMSTGEQTPQSWDGVGEALAAMVQQSRNGASQQDRKDAW